MKRIPILFSSLSVIAVVGACAPASQVTTRADTTPLSFQQSPELNSVEEQAVALNHMADQLVYRSTVQGAASGAIISCGVASLWGGARSCAVGAAAGGAAGGFLGRAFGKRDVDTRVELVSADALVKSIRGMNGQMDALQISLPELIAEQDAELSDMKMRRDVGALSQTEYEQGVFTISQSRARIAHALTLTEEQAKQANFNMQNVGEQGQDGLDWHLSATAQLAREANSARSMISPLELPVGAEIAPVLPKKPIAVQATAEPAIAPVTSDVVWTPAAGTELANVHRPGVLR